MSRPAGGWTVDLLNAAAQRADPIGHDVVVSLFDEGGDRVNEANRVLVSVPRNDSLPDFTGVAPQLAESLTRFLETTRTLPSWAETDRIRRAEDLFFDHGILAILALFIASLPECYVVPSIAEVLNISGELVSRAEYRIRSTARMIVPVMAHGGLTGPDGYGIGNVQRVRLIHATIRHLILAGTRSTSEMEAASMRRHPERTPGAAVLPDEVQEAMRAAGWDVSADGAPINQVEMAYTILTFSYVSVRALGELGVQLTPGQQEDYLHCWNVAGHILGLERDLMADTMPEAAELFAAIRARALPHPRHARDARPALEAALLTVIDRHLPFRVLKPMPALLTRLLVGSESASALHLRQHYGAGTRVAFAIAHRMLQLSELVFHTLQSRFSLVRLISRVFGYHLFKGLLLDETLPLKLPSDCLHPLLDHWQQDPHHGRVAYFVERLLTGPALSTLAR